MKQLTTFFCIPGFNRTLCQFFLDKELVLFSSSCKEIDQQRLVLFTFDTNKIKDEIPPGKQKTIDKINYIYAQKLSYLHTTIFITKIYQEWKEYDYTHPHIDTYPWSYMTFTPKKPLHFDCPMYLLPRLACRKLLRAKIEEKQLARKKVPLAFLPTKKT